MTESDDILQGLFIGGFLFVGLNAVVYYMRTRCRKSEMKKSPSCEELSSVSTEDPQI